MRRKTCIIVVMAGDELLSGFTSFGLDYEAAFVYCDTQPLLDVAWRLSDGIGVYPAGTIRGFCSRTRDLSPYTVHSATKAWRERRCNPPVFFETTHVLI